MKLNMKIGVAVLLLIISAVACKKDVVTSPTNNSNNNTSTGSCSGDKLCFKLDGTLQSYNSDVTWKVTTNGNRVYWENGSQTAYENIEIDVKGTSTGVYDVSKGDAGFQLFKVNGNINIQATSGTIEVTQIDNNNNTISGKFTITATDQNNNTTHQITDGYFQDVPK